MAGKPDHIVVGSGINGLVCAAMLGRKGRRVLLLEREDRLGGCMASGEITAPGFTHDILAATLVLFVTGPAYPVLAKDLAKHGFELCDAAKPTGVLRPDGSFAVVTRDRAANAAALDALHAGDGAAHLRTVEGVESEADLIFSLIGGRLWSLSTAWMLAKRAARRGPAEVAAFFGGSLESARGWLETEFEGETARALWAPWTLHVGLSPERAASGMYARVIAFALEAAGAPIAKGGVGTLPEAFRRMIEAQGGVVRTGADVAEVLVEGGRATGVRLADGETVHAEKGVACSVTPTQLYGRLLGDAAPPEAAALAAKWRYGKGNFQLHYALDGPPDWPDPALRDVALLHLTPGLDGVSKAVNECDRGLLPATPTICVGQPTALDPSRAPEGKATLWLQMPEAPRVVKGDAAGEIETPADGRWTEALREAYADRIEAILERHAPGLRKKIIARVALSPADHEAMNMNLVGGDPYGGYCGLDQAFLWRPLRTPMNHATPIKGLWHIGASTHPGPGLNGGSGFLAAERMA